MIKHEQRNCPRCDAEFECKVGSILLCQCTEAILTEEERDYVISLYDDCLCASCLSMLKSEYQQKKFNEKLNRALGTRIF